jgi:hypothetical protein
MSTVISSSAFLLRLAVFALAVLAASCGSGSYSACYDECVAGTQCSASGQQTCERGFDGCYRWSAAVPCQNGQICLNNACSDCSENSQCDDASVCSGRRCALAAGREYEFTIVSVVVPTQTTGGAAWDPFGGAPDPYVSMQIDDVSVLFTRSGADTFSATLGDKKTVVIQSTSKIKFYVYDDDSSDDDYIDGVTIGDAIQFVRTGGTSGPLYSGSKTSLEVKVTPR